MANSQLGIYNDALMLCEERFLAGANGVPTENRKPRFLLDQVWNEGGVQHCLEEGLWTFATRTTSIVYDPNIQPAFGYIHAFAKPSDYIRTAALASEPYFQDSLTRVADETGYWWADLATIYVKYISNDPNYGMNMNAWPQTFSQFVSAHFASRIVQALTHDKDIQQKVEMARKKTLMSARGKDGMNEPPGFFPRGTWSRARNGMYGGRRSSGDGSGSGWY